MAGPLEQSPSQDGLLLKHIGRKLDELRRRYIRDGRHWDFEFEALRLLCVSGVHSRSEIPVEAAGGENLLMTYATAARRLAISDSSLRRLVRSGDIPTVSVGGSIRISEADLCAYVETLDRRRTAAHDEEEIRSA